MTTKKDILDWYCLDGCGYNKTNGECWDDKKCPGYIKLSSLLDELIDSAPSKEPNPEFSENYGYNKHREEVENWKNKQHREAV